MHTFLRKWLSDKRLFVRVIIFCALALNINTLGNQYAMDDDLVILNNLYVQQGVSGIGKILSSDAYQSYYDQLNAGSPLGGGRYRPLSILSFALEQQIFGATRGADLAAMQQEIRDLQASGNNPERLKELSQESAKLKRAMLADNLKLAPVRHAFQILYFILAVLALYCFLSRYLLPGQEWIAFLSVLLFVFHPVHTEVVANLKSRDELFSLLFLSLGFSAWFRYVEGQQRKDLLLGAVLLLLALLSKEYGLLFFLLLPIGIRLRYGKSPGMLKSRWFLTVLGITIAFVALRFAIVSGNGGEVQGPELLNDPFLYATTAQKLATKISLMLQYLRLLFFPRLLSYDYSYNQFPYVAFSDYTVWLSLITWGGIAAIGVSLWRRGHILAFAFALLLGPLMLVNNLLFDIGATIGERLIFHSSVGFCIIIAWLLVKASERLVADGQRQKLLAAAIMIGICVPMGYKTIIRNADWKNDYTLHTRDVRVVPNSALANANAGVAYFNFAYDKLPPRETLSDSERSYLKPYATLGIQYLTRALRIYPGYVVARMNRGICYMNAGKLDSAAFDWIAAARQYRIRNPALVRDAGFLYEKGRDLGAHKDYDQAIYYFRLGIQIDSANAQLWDNLGGALFMTGHMEEAADAFRHALSIDPQLQDAINGSNAVHAQLQAPGQQPSQGSH